MALSRYPDIDEGKKTCILLRWRVRSGWTGNEKLLDLIVPGDLIDGEAVVAEEQNVVNIRGRQKKRVKKKEKARHRKKEEVVGFCCTRRRRIRQIKGCWAGSRTLDQAGTSNGQTGGAAADKNRRGRRRLERIENRSVLLWYMFDIRDSL